MTDPNAAERDPRQAWLQHLRALLNQPAGAPAHSGESWQDCPACNRDLLTGQTVTIPETS